jgi:UDP-GlcNAc:undecaprenyl-phosphate GlcNAc-1-phosphate transferase
VTPLLLAGLALAAVAFVVSASLCALVRVVAPRVGLVDRPGGRKAHKRPTPLGGGVAIWLTVVLILAAGALAVRSLGPEAPPEIARHLPGLKSKGGELAGVMTLATIIMAMGLWDDRFGLGWKPRLGVQVLLAAFFVYQWGGITLFLPPQWHWLAGTLTVVWIVGLTNAFNFLDNMDGLAASVALIASALFAAAQAAVGSLFVPAVLLVLVGALGGFLVHNHYPARLFMGDAGSNFLGFLLGTLTVLGTYTKYEPGYSPFAVLTPLLVMAVPLYDTTSVILIRLREGRSPFQADRRHFSHRLVDRGLTPPRAVATIDLVTLAGGLGSLLLHRLGPLGALVVLAQTACLLGLVAVLEVSTPGRADPGPKSESKSERTDGEATAPQPRPGPLSPGA